MVIWKEIDRNFVWTEDGTGLKACQRILQGDGQICTLEGRLTRVSVVRNDSKVARDVRSKPRVYRYLSRGW